MHRLKFGLHEMSLATIWSRLYWLYLQCTQRTHFWGQINILVLVQNALFSREPSVLGWVNYLFSYSGHINITQWTPCFAVPPSVEVRPSTQFHTSGSTVVLKCHADGIPQPQLSWEINESALPADNSTAHHYALLRESHAITDDDDDNDKYFCIVP